MIDNSSAINGTARARAMLDANDLLTISEGTYGPITLQFDASEVVTLGKTVNGGDGNDTLAGTEGDDIVNGGDGDDTIDGLGGDDVLNGGDGDDTIDGGDGDNSLDGGNGNDTMTAGGGNNTMTGGDGDDTIDGGDGNDSLCGGNGDDVMDAGGGNDTMTGGDGNDTMTGGGGNDTMTGWQRQRSVSLRSRLRCGHHHRLPERRPDPARRRAVRRLRVGDRRQRAVRLQHRCHHAGCREHDHPAERAAQEPAVGKLFVRVSVGKANVVGVQASTTT